MPPCEHFLTATRLSSVCQTWRDIALKTHNLWTQMIVYVNDNLEDLGLSMQRTSKRARSNPIDIVLHLAGKEKQVTSFFQTFKLDTIKPVSSLLIQLDKIGEVGLLNHPKLQYERLLEKLTIESKGRRGPGSEEVSWDFSFLLRNFAQARSLVLHGFTGVVTGDAVVSQSLRTLELGTIEIFNYATLPRLKNLEKLILSEVRGWEESLPDKIVLPYLQELEIYDTYFPWHVIQAPQLHKLVADIDDLEEERTTFICRHASIVYLETCLDSEGFKQIAATLNGLEYLDLRGYMDGLFDWEKLGLKFPPFPKLTDLKISVPGDEEITSKEFEKLVKGRCPTILSAARAYKGLAQLKTLEIVDYDEQIRSNEWVSIFLGQSSRSIFSAGDYDGEPLATVRYQWG